MKTRIHINMHNIRANRETGCRRPVVTCKDYKENRYGHEAEIVDDSGVVVAKVIYRPDDPLKCGARVWIETELKVVPILWGD